MKSKRVESDAREEDDLGRREAEVVSFLYAFCIAYLCAERTIFADL